MNLIVTDRCNRSCPYCFGGTKVEHAYNAEKPTPSFISLESVELYLEFLARSGIREFKILGGEPSLHPRLGDIVQRGLERGFDVKIFTNGLWPASARSCFNALPDERVSFIVNVNEPSFQDGAEMALLRKSLQIMSRRATIGFNIYRPEFDLGFAPGLIAAFGLQREIRLGLAHPIARGQNAYLSSDCLPQIGNRLIGQLGELEQQDILGSIDCGFPLCMFDEPALGKLSLTTRRGFESNCGVIIDVGTDLVAWPCFPLSEVLTAKLTDFKNYNELDAYFTQKLKPLRVMGSMDKCLGCKYLQRGQCCGGCIGRTIRHWEKNGDPLLLEKMRSFW